jgi:hypothetical protein
MSVERIVLLAALTIFGRLCVAADDSPPPGVKPPFLVFDGLLYDGRPNSAALGMTPIRGLNPQGNVVGEKPVDEAHVRAMMQPFHDYKGVIYLDYEDWPLLRVAEPKVAENMQKLTRVMQIAHEAAPAAIIGYYDVIPCRDYWSLIKNNQQIIRQLQACDARGDELSQHVDVVMPSLYTFYNDPQGWDIYAGELLNAARRYHKPVYAFLWPEFHVGNPILKGHNLPANFWRHELEFCKARADGIVIWGGWQEHWDEQAPWWLETKSFLASLKAH